MGTPFVRTLAALRALEEAMPTWQESPPWETDPEWRKKEAERIKERTPKRPETGRTEKEREYSQLLRYRKLAKGFTAKRPRGVSAELMRDVPVKQAKGRTRTPKRRTERQSLMYRVRQLHKGEGLKGRMAGDPSGLSTEKLEKALERLRSLKKTYRTAGQSISGLPAPTAAKPSSGDRPTDKGRRKRARGEVPHGGGQVGKSAGPGVSRTFYPHAGQPDEPFVPENEPRGPSHIQSIRRRAARRRARQARLDRLNDWDEGQIGRQTSMYVPRTLLAAGVLSEDEIQDLLYLAEADQLDEASLRDLLGRAREAIGGVAKRVKKGVEELPEKVKKILPGRKKRKKKEEEEKEKKARRPRRKKKKKPEEEPELGQRQAAAAPPAEPPPSPPSPPAREPEAPEGMPRPGTAAFADLPKSARKRYLNSLPKAQRKAARRLHNDFMNRRSRTPRPGGAPPEDRPGRPGGPPRPGTREFADLPKAERRQIIQLLPSHERRAARKAEFDYARRAGRMARSGHVHRTVISRGEGGRLTSKTKYENPTTFKKCQPGAMISTPHLRHTLPQNIFINPDDEWPTYPVRPNCRASMAGLARALQFEPRGGGEAIGTRRLHSLPGIQQQLTRATGKKRAKLEKAAHKTVASEVQKRVNKGEIRGSRRLKLWGTGVGGERMHTWRGSSGEAKRTDRLADHLGISREDAAKLYGTSTGRRDAQGPRSESPGEKRRHTSHGVRGGTDEWGRRGNREVARSPMHGARPESGKKQKEREKAREAAQRLHTVTKGKKRMGLEPPRRVSDRPQPPAPTPEAPGPSPEAQRLRAKHKQSKRKKPKKRSKRKR